MIENLGKVLSQFALGFCRMQKLCSPLVWAFEEAAVLSSLIALLWKSKESVCGLCRVVTRVALAAAAVAEWPNVKRVTILLRYC